MISSFDTVSSIGRSSLSVSSGSFCLLPAFPKIFHGRESELGDLVDTLLMDLVRVAVLGPGGMGKTTLAKAALHHPKVATKYQTRYFISCESAHTKDSLVGIVGAHLELDTSSISERAVHSLLSAGQPCLMILDNFETPWEAMDGRAQVEEFLALLADIPHLALLLTMRGAERPGRVQWTHPFLRPLMPLDRIAARQTFAEIADEIHDELKVDQLLDITDNIPLTVQLIASISASEGCESTLKRWNLERTALLSQGYDKQSNLDISIEISLSSPRMVTSPHAVELLSLMSLLSDDISDLDLNQSNIAISDIRSCKATLIRASLAYVDHAGRLKVLSPIREYVRLARPPSLLLVRPLRRYFIDLLKIYMTWMDGSSVVVDLIPRLVLNLGNLHNILLQGLDSDHTDLRESILGVTMLSSLNVTMNRGLTPLMLRLPEILSGMDDHEIQGRFITSAFEAKEFYTLPNPELAIGKAIEHFRFIQDHDEEVRLYCSIASYYYQCTGHLKKAEEFYSLGLYMAAQCSSDAAKIRPLAGLSVIECHRGKHSRALNLAQETYEIARVSGNIRGQFKRNPIAGSVLFISGRLQTVHKVLGNREGAGCPSRSTRWIDGSCANEP
ncbi:hypothetical protein B0H14DRAFT_1454581 [Mycena olivaceomarginata]|nr:hypothetical protein B0H14DRAFT_1454581 [Mycena olivaceomarginata]